VQPIARELGLAMLSTLHERIGDTLTLENASPYAEGWGQSGWARFFGEQVDKRFESFAEPSAKGREIGVQAGFDIWRGSFIPGHHDAAGVYFAYGNGAVDASGLVTNPAATGYVFSKTGNLNLQAYSGGAYWTHYGPGGWYLDAVLQGTAYTGDATTIVSKLPTDGSGFIASLEGGYPIPLPLGPNFILEPQGQIIYQRVGFHDAYDDEAAIGLGTTSGATGRLGVRGQWTINTEQGQVWQPYVRANVWHNWGAKASLTSPASLVSVPLLENTT
jgi:outer membrane autotransporter protein